MRRVEALQLGRNRATAVVAFFGALRVRAIATAIAVPIAALRGQRWTCERNGGHRNDRTAGKLLCSMNGEGHLHPLCRAVLGQNSILISRKSRLIAAVVWQRSLIVANVCTMISCGH